MRHRRANRKLSRPTDQRLALIRGLVDQLFVHGKITTTESRAQAAKRVAEKTITMARKDSLQARRLARRNIYSKQAFLNLFSELVPKVGDRKGGYLKIVKLPPRRGDMAEMAVLTFVD